MEKDEKWWKELMSWKNGILTSLKQIMFNIIGNYKFLAKIKKLIWFIIISNLI